LLNINIDAQVRFQPVNSAIIGHTCCNLWEWAEVL
jgi:hypothetical protein